MSISKQIGMVEISSFPAATNQGIIAAIALGCCPMVPPCIAGCKSRKIPWRAPLPPGMWIQSMPCLGTVVGTSRNESERVREASNLLIFWKYPKYPKYPLSSVGFWCFEWRLCGSWLLGSDLMFFPGNWYGAEASYWIRILQLYFGPSKCTLRWAWSWIFFPFSIG